MLCFSMSNMNNIKFWPCVRLAPSFASRRVDKLFKGSECFDIRQPPDEHLKRTLAKLKLKAVQTLEQFPTGISLQLASLLATDSDVFLK